MTTIYIIIILLCRIVQAIFNKQTSQNIGSTRTLIKYITFSNTVSSLLGLCVIIAEGKGFRINLLTVIISAFSGLSLYALNCCCIYAMKGGTVSLCSMFSTAGMIIPILAGIFLFNKPMSIMQWLGVAIFMVSSYLLIGNSRDIFKGFSIKTFFLLIGSMFANGLTMLAQQLFTAYVPDGNVTVFSFLSFSIIAILSPLAIIFTKDKKVDDELKHKFLPRPLIICGLFLATAVFIINQLVTICTLTVSPAVLFAFVSMGATIISTVVAAIMYKEPLTVKAILGVVLGITALFIIKMF